MKTSQSIEKIAPALLAAQKKIGAATKGSVNPFFKSTYASLGDVMEACKDILNENGITVLQPIDTAYNGGVEVETVLLHDSGEWISSGLKIAPKTESNPQDQGSAISYARRYSLQSMVFIPAEDDDAEKAVNRTSVASQPIVSGEHVCTIHNVAMKQRIAPAGGHYYDHRQEVTPGVWEKCNGTGFKGDMKRVQPEIEPEIDIKDINF